MSIDNLIRSVAKMDAIADIEIARLRADAPAQLACKAGCDHCCHRVVVLGVSEVIRIASHVNATFTPAQREALQSSSEAYAAESLPFRDGRQGQARPRCPLLVDGLCSVYDIRPVGCRGWNSYSAPACELKKQNPLAPGPPGDERQNNLAQTAFEGHSRELESLGLAHQFVDLGLALPELLSRPELLGQYAAGSPILLEHAIVQPGPDLVREARKRSKGTKAEPSGFLTGAPAAGHPVYEFMRMSVPNAFASQDQIDSSLARYRRMVEEFVDIPMDAGEAFDALSRFQTFGLPYTGEDVTSLLKLVGDNIVGPIVARAFPDLVAPIEPRSNRGRLRVGYLSCNFSKHHSTNFSLGWISHHAEDIESFVFHTGAVQDSVSLQFRMAADHFYHVPGDVPSTARFIKSLGLDVLVFPDIGNFGENYQYAGMRLAPVQCTSWGQPVTSGLSTIDYFLSSAWMEPENGDGHYSEKLIRLPGSIHWNRNLTPPSTKTRSELGIPEGLVYFVAQNIRKLTPKWDTLYDEIQARTGAPIVFIDLGVESAAEVTRERFERAGIRAVWLPKMSQADFVRAQQLCDVSLDPPAWSGGNTTETGLGVNSPIVTLPGPFMRGRHNLAFMNQANVPGLIASSPSDYVDLATDLDRLHGIMQGLDPQGLLEDPSEPAAINTFLRAVTGRG